MKMVTCDRPDRRALLRILSLAAVYSLAASCELFWLLGREELFLAQQSAQPNLSYGDFQQFLLLRFWGGLIPVITLAGYAYWGWPRFGLRRFGTGVFVLILTYTLMTQLLELRLDSIFYYLRSLSLIGLILTVLNARRLSQTATR